MAQDLLDRFTPLHHQPANVGGGSFMTPVLFHGHTALKAVDGENRVAYFKSVMNTLMNSSGLIVRVEWFTPATSGLISLSAAFERHEPGFSYTGGGFAAAKTVTAAPSGTTTGATYTDILFAAGAQVDGILILESYRLSIQRNGAEAGDTLGAAAYISTISLRNLA